MRGVLELAGARYVNLAFLWGRRWRSLGDAIRVTSVPKWAGGRYAIPPASFPFLRSSSLHPPLPESFLTLPSNYILASPSFSSLLVPLSSLPLFAKETRWHLRPSAWLPRALSLGSPSLGPLSSWGSSGSIGSLHCIELLHFASHEHVYCFVLHIALVHIALLCLELYFIALPCT